MSFEPTKYGHKLRHERSWRSYRDFQKPQHFEPEAPEGPRDQFQSDRAYDFDSGREDVFREYEEDYGWDPDEYREEYEPIHEHDLYEQEYESSYEHWMRSRYGASRSVPPDLPAGSQYRSSESAVEVSPLQPTPEYYYPDEHFTNAPDYYKERYMPEEDYLKKFYMIMFRNIEYDIKVPIMQIIATGALFFIFVMNYMINIEYVYALSNFSPWVKIQPPFVGAILGMIFGFFIYLFPNLDRDLKRTVIIGTIILLIFFFTIPIFASRTFDTTIIGQRFAETIVEFLKLAAVLVYWAPLFLGIYGIWSKNNFYVGVSAMFLFLTIIILDIYLFYEGQAITKIRDNWVLYVIFSIILFCYIEMSDSAVTFANLTSTANQEEIDPSYYEHLDRILKKYFVYFILLTIFIIILTWITMNFSAMLQAAGSSQIAESLELTSIYGTMISLIVIGIIILFIGLFLRYERAFRRILNRFIGLFQSQRSQVNYTPGRITDRDSHRQNVERDRVY